MHWKRSSAVLFARPTRPMRFWSTFTAVCEAIVTDYERIGCLPILIIPPGNDASEPNQSYADPATGARPRGRRCSDCLMDILSIPRNADPDRAIAAYQEVVREAGDARSRLITGWRG